MTTWVVLLRGINVGASKRISMIALRKLVEELGYTNVSTYLNSGNIVFTTQMAPNKQIAKKIHDVIQLHLHMDIDIIVRTAEEMRAIVNGNPFPERAEEPKTLHVAFLAGTPGPKNVEKLADQARGEDDFRIIGNNIYLSYPNGVSGAVFQPKLDMPQTSRNWSTVTKLADIAASTSG